MIKLSHLTSYITCPRLCYFRIHDGDESFTEFAAIREIYLSMRQGFDLDWARKRARALHKAFDDIVFDSAARKFVYPQIDCKTVDIDIVLKSESLGLLVSVEEIVECNGEAVPLFISLNPPEKGVWMRDMIKAGAASIAGNYSNALIYYAYTGDVRRVEVTFSLRRKVIKLIERVKLIQRGFLPERRESRYCDYCSFSEECERKSETFASKFL
ncbi:MAG: Dna2/Cas4 domain-containing protein [Archaeoglobus sp.]|uniref:Dna2/Cas4 domain-containing protein n=1 Tax=Archaeoglobus sp. TaxID=1872626 RepID=UPI001D9B5B05|nr:Dna2/Cas4 domain-containing protein [Archaeoglobus sp.]MBO8180345.1 Dna2/Cas4 domain-containing protein [Archaeoglobus sp.]